MQCIKKIKAAKRLFPLIFLVGTATAMVGTISAQPSISKAGIYLQLDKTVYGRGETIWFNAYLFTPDRMPAGSTLQVELIREDSVWQRVMYPVVLGVTNGQLQLTKELSSGWYQLRAFTEQAALPSFHTFIYIIGKNRPAKPANNPLKEDLILSLYPESGTLIAGIETRVAFKAIDLYGNPKPVQGSVVDTHGKEVAVFATWAGGMGEFVFTPEADNAYTAVWFTGGEQKKQTLPPVQPNGTMLSLINHPKGFLFDIRRKGATEIDKSTWLCGSMDGQELFRQPLPKNQPTIQGVLKTKELSSGILNIQVLTEAGTVLTNRKVFVNNEEYRLPITLRTDTLSFLAKGKNKWVIELPDSLQGTCSISVTDAELDGEQYRQSSILSQTMLPAETGDPLLQSDWYFNTSSDSAEIGLDLLMLTQKDYPSALDTMLLPSVSINKKGFITLQGRAYLRGTRQPLANSRLMAVLSGNRMRNQILFTETDKSGKFMIDSLLFFGKVRVFFGEQRAKKAPRFLDIQLDEDSIPPLSISNRAYGQSASFTPADFPSPGLSWVKDYEDIIRRAEGLTLEEVTIKTRAKSPLQKLQEEYTSGIFDTDAFVERVLDLVNNDEANSYPNILEYLRFRVQGLQIMDPDFSRPPPDLSQSGGFDVRNDPTKYRIFFRQMPSASSMGNVPMVIYLNEVETDADILLTIPASDIALVKIFSSFTAAPGGGPGGALAVYTKKPELLRQISGSAVTFSGYSSNSPFPSPNYDADPTVRNNTDGRVTLDWRPNIFLTAGRKQIPLQFYNNDRTRKFRLRLEGLTTSGKPIFFEKIVQ